MEPCFLILVKHSLPEIVPEVPANEWRLSETGRARCKPLAEKVAPYLPELVISSPEPKAVETGERIARQLGRSFHSLEGLHEHDRTGVGFQDRSHFEAQVRDLFRHPDELIMGRETARQARSRFSQAVGMLEEEYPDKSLAVVAHGTVITLFVEAAAGLEPFPFWKKLDLPSFVVFTLPEHRLVATVESVV